MAGYVARRRGIGNAVALADQKRTTVLSGGTHHNKHTTATIIYACGLELAARGRDAALVEYK